MLALRNVVKTWLLLVALCAVLGAAGWALGGYRLLSVFAFGGLLLGAAVYWSADRVVTGMLGARELLPAEAPALHSMVERLASRAPVVKPRLYLLPDGFPRALAGGRGGAGSIVALSAGFLAAASPAELEGVLAHEIAHFRHRDVLLQTVAVVLATGLLELARIGGWLQRALLFALGPVAAACVHLLLSPAREFAADHLAASLCASPHGLADALLRLDGASDLVEFRASPTTEPLYTVNPFEEEGLSGLFTTHPPVAERVRRLRALAPAPRGELAA